MENTVTAPLTPKELAAIKASLVKTANDQNVGKRQYIGHWETPDWNVYQVKKDIKSKMGTSFVKWELALGRDEGMKSERYNRAGVLVIGGPLLTLYSSGTKIDTIIDAKYAKLVG